MGYSELKTNYSDLELIQLSWNALELVWVGYKEFKQSS